MREPDSKNVEGNDKTASIDGHAVDSGDADNSFVLLIFRSRLSQILCLSIFLGVVELLLKTDHKLTHRLLPILDRHRPIGIVQR